MILSDSSTVESYIFHQGGTHSFSLCQLALDLLRWYRQRKILLSASHIVGDQNLVADFLSRGNFLPSEWTLDENIFVLVCQSFGQPEVDLFASALNYRLPRFCSRTADSQTWAVDAFSTPWRNFLGYVLLPFGLFPKVLVKIALEESEILLLAPLWPSRPWFPRLLSL